MSKSKKQAKTRCAGLVAARIVNNNPVSPARRCRNLSYQGEIYCLQHHPDRSLVEKVRQQNVQKREAERVRSAERWQQSKVEYDKEYRERLEFLRSRTILPYNEHQCPATHIVEDYERWAEDCDYNFTLPELVICSCFLGHPGRHEGFYGCGGGVTWSDSGAS